MNIGARASSPPQPCSLVTRAEIQKVFATRVQRISTNHRTACIYGTTNPSEPLFSVEIQVYSLPRKELKQIRTGLAASPMTRPVKGLGGFAIYRLLTSDADPALVGTGKSAEVVVVLGDTAFSVQGTREAKAPTMRELVRLAKLGVRRL